MNARIAKWGNSPALRIPKALMSAAGFSAQQRVTITATDGRLVVEPAPKEGFDLDHLIDQIKPENLHEPIEFGPAMGKELL